MLEDQISRPNIDQPPEDSKWQPCEVIWSCKVSKLIPVRCTRNLGEAAVELIIRAAKNGFPNIVHIVLRPARILILYTKGMKPSEGDTVIISEGQCMTYQTIRYVYGSSTLGLGVLTSGLPFESTTGMPWESTMSSTWHRPCFKYRPCRPRYQPRYLFLPAADTIWKNRSPYHLQQKTADI